MPLGGLLGKSDLGEGFDVGYERLAFWEMLMSS